MNIIIVGLGLIGASFAKSLKKYTKHHIIGIDINSKILNDALNSKIIDEIGSSKSITKADIIYLCIYPESAINFIKENINFIPAHCIVVDTCGIKCKICNSLVKLSRGHFEFVGSHPMAGKEKNGFYESSAELFKNASYIIVPCEASDTSVNIVKNIALEIGFSKIKFTTPEEHDNMIAFTSQIPHVLACAYVLSPQCRNHDGFSAGSYRDISRVAKINELLWSELFIYNKKPLVKELDLLINNLNKIKNLIKNNELEKLRNILKQVRIIKEELDK